MLKNYCIIGTGVAAVNAAKAIRDNDHEANIHVFGSEKSLPYNRIKLSKDLYSDLSSEKVLIKKEKWYKDQNITLHLDTMITEMDTANRSIVSVAGETIQYDELLICTGALNRNLSIDGVDKKVFLLLEKCKKQKNLKHLLRIKIMLSLLVEVFKA
jgi:nitrite reductase (NADH) large subunit